MCSYVRHDMLLCRRLLFTADPQYPAVTFFAKLPSLVFHINEHKVGVVTDFEIIKVFQQDYSVCSLSGCYWHSILLYLIS